MCIPSNDNYPFLFRDIRSWPSDNHSITQLSDVSNVRLLFATVKGTIIQNALRDSDILWLYYLAEYRENVRHALGMHTSERPLYNVIPKRNIASTWTHDSFPLSKSSPHWCSLALMHY
jgi:hypothetical protein